MVVLPSCRAGGGCVVVLECGHRVVVVVVEPIIGCHVVESDDVAPGSVVNNKVRGGNGDLLRIETTLSATWHLGFRRVLMASCHSLGDMALPRYSCCGGYGRRMWVVANGDGDNDVTVVMRRRW